MTPCRTTASQTWDVSVSRCMAYCAHAISRSLSKFAGGVHEYEKASKRRASLQAMRHTTARRHITPPPDVTRDTG